ncbi:MAG TPA: hypothetical protein VNM41_05820, partial [Solirubrobacterales bacterium]|nr:hypothetical protein [Solirubrobacterales bacterium]
MTLQAGLAELARHASTPLPERPLLVPWVRPAEIGDGLLELRAAETFYPLRHPLLASAFRAVGSRLDGEHDLASICAGLPDGLEPSTVAFLLKTLRANGLLLDGGELDVASEGVPARRLFFSSFTVHPGAVERRLAAAAPRVVGPERLAGRVAGQLRAAGFSRVEGLAAADLEASDGADLLIACADVPARAFFSHVNDLALQAGRPWLRAAMHGDRAWLGPLVLPGESACFACLEARERASAQGSGEWPELATGDLGAFAPQEDLLALQA